LPSHDRSAISIKFQPTGGGKAAITGDFVALASEVNPLIASLRQHGIEVTAIHNHMLNDEPRMFFIISGRTTTRRSLQVGCAPRSIR
jgi:hypothetical protein